MSKLMVGTAKTCITPTPDLLPGPCHKAWMELTGVRQDVYVRTLILACGGKRVVMMAFDLADMGRMSDFQNILMDTYGFELKELCFAATHQHYAPMIAIEHHNLATWPEEKIAQVKNYGDYVIKKTVESVGEALKNMRPAKLGFGTGMSYINANNNQDYANSLVTSGDPVRLASDKTLAVLKIDDLEGNLIAALVNYGSHGLPGASAEDGEFLIASDLPGCVSCFVEKKFEESGAVCLWTSGAAGDQAPITPLDYRTLNDDYTASEVKVGLGAGVWRQYENLAIQQGEDVLRVLNSIDRMKDEIRISIVDKTVAVEAKDETRDYRPGYGPDPSNGLLDMHFRLVTLDDVAFFGIDCELFSQSGINLKAASPLKNTVIVQHTHFRTGYMPDQWGVDHNVMKCKACHVKLGMGEHYIREAMLEMFDERLRQKD